MSRRADQTSDADLTNEILLHRDSALSHIAATLKKALADNEPAPCGLNQRHPDFAKFAVRIGRALGHEHEAVEALKAAETDKSLFCLENDTVGAALLTYMRRVGTFSGVAADLYSQLCKNDPEMVAVYQRKASVNAWRVSGLTS